MTPTQAELDAQAASRASARAATTATPAPQFATKADKDAKAASDAKSAKADGATKADLEAKADKAEEAAAESSAKAAQSSTKADKDAAAKDEATAQAARADADAGPTYGSITVTLTGSLSPKGDTQTFRQNDQSDRGNTVQAAVKFLNALEAALDADEAQFAKDQKDLDEAEARDQRLKDFKSGNTPAKDPNAGRDLSKPT